MIKFLRHLVVDDFQLKLFSLALALLFWLTVSFAIQQKEGSPPPTLTLTTEVRTFFNLPVVVMSSASDVRHFKVSPDQVQVTVQGDARIVKNLQSKDIRVMVDLTGIEAAHSLHKRIEVSTPAGVTHVGVLPEEVQVIIPSKPPPQ
jgi:YbbR domain-containing protein